MTVSDPATPETAPVETPRKPTLSEAIFNRRMLICVGTGFSSGLPLYVLLQMIPAWLRDQGVSLTEIGLLALATMPYTWKFLWSPLMDRFVPQLGGKTLLGRRRGWLLLTQVALLLLIGSFGWLQLEFAFWVVGALAFAVALFSATQDIALDAFRRELLPDAELGLGNSIHVQAYRLAGLVPGSLALILADHIPWSTVYWIVAAFMLISIAMTLLVAEPPATEGHPTTLREAVVEPFREMLTRLGIGPALLVFAFLVLYKLGDNMATALQTPFFIDVGFSLTTIGLVGKNAALWSSIIGGLVGGVVMIKLGINRALWLFGVVQLVSIAGFALLAQAGPVPWLLAVVMSFEYLGVGLGTAAFTAFIARTTSRRYAATQFALFTALTAVPRTLANASTGAIVEITGWVPFYLLCMVVAVPGMLLLFWVAPWRAKEPVI